MSKLRPVARKTRNDEKAEKNLMRGFEVHRGKILRFVTLTNCKSMALFRKLVRCFRENIKEYFGVRTAEGGGVVHFVYIGKSVRYEDLSKAWLNISGFWNVSITSVKDLFGVTRELTRQKLTRRYFYSKRWLTGLNSVQVRLSM